MSSKTKLFNRLQSEPKDFTWDELIRLLSMYGFEESQKTGGSGRKFFNKETNQIIQLHKPHPSNVLKKYAIKYVKELLKKHS